MTVDWNKLSTLYYEADSMVNRNDSVFLYNSKLDTVVTETGIFTQLRYDYLMIAPWDPYFYTKEAIQLEDVGEVLKAKSLFQKVIKYHQIEMPRTEYSCANDYHTANIHSAMLASYAYEKIGKPDSAIIVLKPWLANYDASDTGIQERYVQLLINQASLQVVRDSFMNAAHSLKKHIITANPRNIMWTLSIFDAPIMVGNGEEYLSTEDATHDLLTKPFCYLID